MSVWDFISDIKESLEKLAVLFILFTGMLTLLTLAFLVSLSQLLGWRGWVADVLTNILFFPLGINILYLSPGLAKVLMYELIVPLIFVSILMLRITVEYIYEGRVKLPLPRALIARLSPPSIVRLPSKLAREISGGYGTLTLFFVSLGATMGPSTFVIIPYAVVKYGPLALLGMALASVSAWALAWRYAKMYYYSKRVGATRVVGGPAFVKYAYGGKHPAYMLSRITMWVGNAALSAFNLLIAVKFLSEYVLPLALGAKGIFPVELALLILLSAVPLLLHKRWRGAVRLQSFVGLLFLMLFLAHLGGLCAAFPLKPALPLPVLPLTVADLGVFDALLIVLASAAYVYIVVFGFQEVMALTEEAKGSEEEKLKSIKAAMVGGAVVSCVLFWLYMYVYVLLTETGVQIPGETVLPALDLVRQYPQLYWLTVAAVGLGVVTTLVPAFASALKHLKELASDFFGVEEGASGVLPFIVILLAWYLFFTGTEFIAHLTDFAVLLSLSIIALSETGLGKKVTGGGRHVISKAISLLTFAMFLLLAQSSPDIAWISALIMILSTAMVMVLSYDLVQAETFVLVICFMTIVFVGGFSRIIPVLAGTGVLSPQDLAMWEGVVVSLWVVNVIFFALLAHIAVKYGGEIANAIRAGARLVAETLRGRENMR